MGEAPPGRSLNRAMGWAVIGQLIFIASQFVVLAALTRFGTLVDVGRFGLAMAITTPIITFFNLGLRQALATDAAGEYGLTEYFRLRIVSSLAALPVMMGASVVASPDLPMTAMTAVIALSKIVESQSDVYYGSFQNQHRMDLVARSLILRGPLTAIIFAVLLWQTGSPIIAFGSQVVVWTAVALLHDRPIAYAQSTSTAHRSDWSRIRQLTRETFWLGIATTIARLTTSAPRFAVNTLLGTAALGLFTAIAYVWQAGAMALQQVNNSLAAPLAQAWHKGHLGRFRSLIRRYALLFAILFLAAAGLAWFEGELLVTLAFGPKYREGAFLLVLMLIVLAIQSATFVYQIGIFCQRQFNAFATLRLVMLGVIAAASAIGAVIDGLEGVGWGLVIFSVIQQAATWWLLQRGFALRGHGEIEA